MTTKGYEFFGEIIKMPSLLETFYILSCILTEESSSYGAASRANLLGFISSCTTYCMAVGKFLNFICEMGVVSSSHLTGLL